MPKKQSKTSKFGVSVRENHDSSAFYRGRLYEGHEMNPPCQEPENPVSLEVLNTVYCVDSRSMKELPDNCVHLMVTSPPYNVGKEYDQDLSLKEFRSLLQAVFAETYRVLAPGGRACINVANLGRKPYIPLHHYVIEDMLNLGFLMRGEIIWNKAASSGTSTAWGSWMSASNPTLRDVHEYILIFCKGDFTRSKENKQSTISKEEFLEFTKSIWSFNTESATKVGHPAPFPLELPRRLIELYTFAGDLVLDPFCGSGTTCLAAAMANRRYIGYDLNPDYVKLSKARLASIQLPLL
jgi:DNA modification methylase